MEKLSVIIPCFNEEHYLPMLLKSLKSQKGVMLDVIVADAGSTDNTRNIIKRFGARMVKGGTPPAGRNNGARNAKYDKLVFLDADVHFGPLFLADSLREMRQRGLEVASVWAEPDSGKSVDSILFGLWNFWIWLTQGFYPHAGGYCIFSNARINRKLKGFDTGLYLGEDSNYVLRASRHGRYGMLHTRLVNSARRLDTEGRVSIVWKMVACGVYRTLFGEPKGNIFNYRFNIHDPPAKRKQ